MRLAVFCLLLLSVAGCGSPIREVAVAPAAPEPDPVAKLVEFKADAASEFVKRLEALAKSQNWHPQFAECEKRAHFSWNEARAETVRADKKQYVVVLLGSSTNSVPGSDVETVILLDGRGKHLDHLACEINSRRTLMEGGIFRTIILAKPAEDGAHLVIRLDGLSVSGNFSHQIHHDGKATNYHWGDDRPPGKPTKWDVKGLCCIAIENGKFKVVFP